MALKCQELGKPCGRLSKASSAEASSLDTGQARSALATCAQLEPTTLSPSPSSAGGSPAKISRARERARAYLESAQACGLSLPGSSKSSALDGSLSKTSPAALSDGSIKCDHTWEGSAMKRYRSLSQRKMSELLTSGAGSSLLPTPSASRYGSNKGGAKGRTRKERPSLDTLAKRGLLATPTATANQLSPSMTKWPGCKAWQAIHPPGPLLPSFVEWMMGFPTDWSALKPSETQ